jgi:hypothetical protein
MQACSTLRSSLSCGVLGDACLAVVSTRDVAADRGARAEQAHLPSLTIRWPIPRGHGVLQHYFEAGTQTAV